MLSREVIEAQRANYVQGREQMVAQVNALNGGIDAMDNLLRILDQMEAHANGPAQVGANGAQAPVEEKEKSHA